jgi:hypothetical protein
MKKRKFSIDPSKFLKVYSEIHLHRLFRETRSIVDLCFSIKSIDCGNQTEGKICPGFITQDKGFYFFDLQNTLPEVRITRQSSMNNHVPAHD